MLGKFGSRRYWAWAHAIAKLRVNKRLIALTVMLGLVAGLHSASSPMPWSYDFHADAILSNARSTHKDG